MHVLVYREHGRLNIETQFIGPFSTFEDAHDYLSYLPALGPCPKDENSGVKYISELLTPNEHGVLLKRSAARKAARASVT